MRLWHRHKWQTIRVEIGTYVLFGGDGSRIYQRCTECGKLGSHSVNGHWSLEELQAAEKRAAR